MTIKILIADDHDVVRAGLKAMFEKSDIRIVAEAADGITAFKLTKKHRPNLVLLDVRMPEGDGLTCLGRIRLDFPDIPVVMFSAFDNSTYIARALALALPDTCLKVQVVTRSFTQFAPRLAAKRFGQRRTCAASPVPWQSPAPFQKETYP